MRAAVLIAIFALASPASAGETTWSETVVEWLDHYDLAVGRYTRADFSSAQAKRGARCRSRGDTMVTCPKKGSFFYDSASFGSEGRAHYFSLTLTTEESLKPCAEIAEHLKAKYGAPSYGRAAASGTTSRRRSDTSSSGQPGASPAASCRFKRE
ncbi:MAG: hypothetical protein WBN01_14010 [Polyangiales bacterium]